MAGALLLTFKIYALAAAISMAVAAMIKAMGAFSAARSAARETPSPERRPGAAAGEEPPPDEAEVAAISAAIAALIGRHRIVRLTGRAQGGAWAAEGRSAHRSSHAVPHRPSPTAPVKPRR